MTLTPLVIFDIFAVLGYLIVTWPGVAGSAGIPSLTRTQLIASAATITPDTDLYDMIEITAQAATKNDIANTFKVLS